MLEIEAGNNTIVDGNIKYTIKTRNAYIYVPANEHSVENMVSKINEIRKSAPIQITTYDDPTRISIYTNTTYNGVITIPYRQSKTTVFIDTTNTCVNTGFAWHIHQIAAFRYNIEHDATLPAHVCSIYIDLKNTSPHPDGTILNKIESVDIYAGYKQVVCDKPVTISAYGSPLGMELSPSWTHFNMKYTEDIVPFRNIFSKTPIEFINNEDLNNMCGKKRLTHCNCCKSVLFGLNYACVYKEKIISVCPWCAHTGDNAFMYTLSKVYKFNSSVSISDMIMIIEDPALKNLLTVINSKLLQHNFLYEHIKVNDDGIIIDINYIDFGEYIGIYDIGLFMTYSIYERDKFVGKKLFPLRNYGLLLAN